MSKFKPISKRIVIKDTGPESFLKVSKAMDLVVKDIEKNNSEFVVLITNDKNTVRSGPQNKLLQSYYNELTKSDWSKNQGYSRADLVIYCKRNIIIEILKEQSTISSSEGFGALEKVSAVRALNKTNASEEVRIKYLNTDGWSSLLDVGHFRKYLIAIELHFLDKINYRLESTNEKLRWEAFNK